MDTDYRIDVSEVNRNIDVADVIALYFPLLRKTLLMDMRTNDVDGPLIKVVPMANTPEERFQSLVSVPMFGRDGEVMGVISLHAEAPHEFERADLDLLEHTASLIAGAVENARLYEEAAARVALLTDLSLMLQGIAGAPTIEDVFATVSIGTRELLGADRAEVYLTDADKRLRLRAASPPRYDERVIDTRTLWCDVLRDNRPHGPEGARYLATALPDRSTLAKQLPFQVQDGSGRYWLPYGIGTPASIMTSLLQAEGWEAIVAPPAKQRVTQTQILDGSGGRAASMVAWLQDYFGAVITTVPAPPSDPPRPKMSVSLAAMTYTLDPRSLATALTA